MTRWPLQIFLLLLLAFSPSTAVNAERAQHDDPSLVGLGHIVFPTSGTPIAQQWFLRGVLLLHNFQYDDAKESFRRAQQLDGGFAMAYWGEAMTANHPLWNEQYLDEGRGILQRLGPDPKARSGKAGTTRERGYLQAIEKLYGEGSKRARDQAYLNAMQQLAKQFPDDLEAGAFHALALLGSTEGERDTGIYMKAAAIAEGVFRKNPKHPGAVHYLIHSYDDPIHAPLGLHAAEIYSSLAPAASHAQHMPSHIYMALGLWDKVIAANEAAWKSSEARIKRKGLTISARPYHTLKWLMYAYLQADQIPKAKQLVELIQEDVRTNPSLYSRGYQATMRAMYIVESQDWSTHHLEEDRSKLRFSFAVSELFAIGLSAVKIHDLPIAKRVLAQFHERLDQQDSSSLSREGVAGLCMAKELEALIVLEEPNTQKAIHLLEEAAALEDSLTFDYGPPIPIKPTHELLGEVLLELGQAERARKEFQQALQRTPNRRLSLQGLEKAERRVLEEAA